MNLRSCAKCGCKAAFTANSPDDDGWYYVACWDDECTSDVVWGQTEEQAARLWNEQQSDLLDLEAEQRTEQ